MIQAGDLDVRTVTMGISLGDCAGRNVDDVSRRVYDKIVRVAGDLVPIAVSIRRKYGIPIVNRRISVTPIAHVPGSDDPADFVRLAHALDAAAQAVGVDFIGGFSALVQKGFTRTDEALITAIPAAVSETQCGMFIGQRSVHAGGHQHGRRGAYGGRGARRLAPYRRSRLHRQRQDHHLLQRPGGQPVHGRRPARRRRARGERQRGHLGAGCGPHRRRRQPGCAVHRTGRPHQADGVQDHPWGRAGRTGGVAPARRADGHHRSLPGPDAGGRRLHSRDPGEHGAAACGGTRLDGRAGAAQRCRQEGWHHGDHLDRRPVGSVHRRERRRGHGRRGAGGRAEHREARGHDGRLLAWTRRDRGPRRHLLRDAGRHDRRCHGHRHGQSQVDGSQAHPGGRQGRGRLGRAGRTVRRGAGHARQRRPQRRLHSSRWRYTGTSAEPQEPTLPMPAASPQTPRARATVTPAARGSSAPGAWRGCPWTAPGRSSAPR